jgi:hypothetical protein
MDCEFVEAMEQWSIVNEITSHESGLISGLLSEKQPMIVV